MIPSLLGVCAAIFIFIVLGSFAWGVIGIIKEDPIKWVILRVSPVFLCLLYLLAMSFSEVK